jgi:lysophospholipase L1-like esterase
MNVIEGVTIYNGDNAAGITVYDDARYGSQTGDWVYTGDDRRSYNRSSIGQVQPHLVVIALGANDMIASVSAATIAANLATRISDIKAACTVAPSIIAISPYPSPAVMTDAQRLELLGIWNAIAGADSSITVLDLSTFMPSVSGDVLALYDADNTHMTPKGQSLVAEHLVNMLAG